MKVGSVLAIRWMLLYFCMCTQPNQLVFSRPIGYHHSQFGWVPNAVLYPPKVLIQKPNYTFLEGTKADISCEIIRGNGTITWKKENDYLPIDVIELSGTPFMSYLHFNELKSTHSGEYFCTAQNKEGEGSDSFQLTVLEPPKCTFPRVQTAALGSNVTILFDCIGFPPPKFTVTLVPLLGSPKLIAPMVETVDTLTSSKWSHVTVILDLSQESYVGEIHFNASNTVGSTLASAKIELSGSAGETEKDEIPQIETATIAMPKPPTPAMPKPPTTAMPKLPTPAMPKLPTPAMPNPPTTAMPKLPTSAMPSPATPTVDFAPTNDSIIIVVVYIPTAIVIFCVLIVMIYFWKFRKVARDEESSGESENHGNHGLVSAFTERSNEAQDSVPGPSNLQPYYERAEGTRPCNPTFITTMAICHPVPDNISVEQVVVEPPLECSQNPTGNAIQEEAGDQEQQIQAPNPTPSCSVMPVQQGEEKEPVINCERESRLDHQMVKILPIYTIQEEVEVWVTDESTTRL